MITAVPGVVPWPEASRHLFPYTTSSLDVFRVQDWLVPPLQSQISVRVLLAVPAFGMSRQRLEAAPRSTPVLPLPLPPPPPGLVPVPQPHCRRSRPDWLVTVTDRLVPLPPRVVMAQEAFSQGPGPCVWVAFLTPVHRTEPMPRLRTVS